jgi:hypothetical protein
MTYRDGTRKQNQLRKRRTHVELSVRGFLRGIVLMTSFHDPAVRLVFAGGALRALLGGQRRPISRLDARYALHEYEGAFARALLAAHSRYWLFRSDQQSRAGDFIAFDRSATRSSSICCFAIELKLRAAVRLGRFGVQLSSCEGVVGWLAERHALHVSAAIPVSGDHAGVLQLLREPRRGGTIS